MCHNGFWDGVTMADIYSTDKRSAIMSRVRAKNTKPEMVVRRLLHRMGYRFRLHSENLPGRPDIVLPRFRTVIFVNGCFWHGHSGCKKSARPTTNAEFWDKKIAANVARDREQVSRLSVAGWLVLTIWQCETQDQNGLTERIRCHMEA
jgi:DNA mismatch endonuclease (patch repair protein)